MRYRVVKDIEFKNKYGIKKTLHGCRTPVVATSGITVVSKELERELDDLAVKMWGGASEIMSYTLREQNLERLLLADFDESKLQSVQVPPPER